MVTFGRHTLNSLDLLKWSQAAPFLCPDSCGFRRASRSCVPFWWVGGCVQVTTLLVCTHIQSLQRVFAHTHIHTHPPGRGRKKERGRDREKGRTRESKRNRERKRPAWHFEFPETEAAGLGRSRFGRSRKRTPLFSAKKRRNSSKDLPNHAQNHGKIVAKNIHLLITTFFLLAVRIKKRKMEAGRAACVSTSITYR